jgi:hypothetical protein
MSTAALTDDQRRMVRLVRPRTPNQLHAYIRTVLGFNVPRVALVDGHDAPFDYVQHAYFEDRQPRDCVVWANRGGGKTQLGAIVTLLDLLFKPGIQVRILGGSFDQSSKMYQYLVRLLGGPVFVDLIDGRCTGRAVELHTGSRVEVLSQAETSVRGQRVHKLRCDEVELFDEEVWQAAQLVTRSGTCGGITVQASIETISTMHRPFGIMQQIIKDAGVQQRRVFKWSVLDTLEGCEPGRECESCTLREDCRGMAKAGIGFIPITDAIQQKRRVGPDTWAAEMLCTRPSRTHSVYPEFDQAVHVRTHGPWEDAAIGGEGDDRYAWLGGIDFGFRAPTVLLWALHDRKEDVLWIVDELAAVERTTQQIIEAAAARNWPQPQWIGADPAGHQRGEQTGRSVISIWKDRGWDVKSRPSRIAAGIGAVRRRLRSADGRVSLRIHARCATLIESLKCYHYPPEDERKDVPIKDGSDHAADALRYLVVNLDRDDWRVTVRNY